MTIQMLATWNGLEEESIYTLAPAEEARLIGLGLARAYTAGMDGVSAGSGTGQASVSGGGAIPVAPSGTDDTASIMAADAMARQVGGYVQLSAGDYFVSQIVVRSGSDIRGAGADTVVKSIAGSNLDVFYGIRSDALWGTSSPSGEFAARVTLRDLTIDGNRANNASGSGIAIWGPRLRVQNVNVYNCAHYGIRTEYLDEAIGNALGSMEGVFENIVIDTTGRHGWWHNGPHDSNCTNVIVVDASQSAAGTWDAIYADQRSTSRWSHIHTWARGASAHPRAGVNLVGGGQEFSNSHFEGGVTASALIQSSKNSFDASCSVFAAWAGTSLAFTGIAPANTYNGKITFHPSGTPGGVPDAVGIRLGMQAGDYIQNNTINAYVEGQNLGAVDYTYSGGTNTVILTSYQTSGPGYIGTPAATDYVDHKMSGGTLGVQRLMTGIPATIKPTVSVNTLANGGWFKLGRVTGTESQTLHLQIQGATGYSANGNKHCETHVFLRAENDGQWRGTWSAVGHPSASGPTALIVTAQGDIYAEIGQYAQIDLIAFGSGRFVQSYAYYGASAPTGVQIVSSWAVKIAGSNALLLQSDGTLQTYAPLQQKSYTVAQLNALTNKAFGMTAFAGNGRKSGETTGNGTGCPVYYGGAAWLTFYDNAVVQA